MAVPAVPPQEYKPNLLEATIQKRWADEKLYEKTRSHREGGKEWYFVDGPPYTTGSIHIGTTWNKTLKDLYIRFMRMKGHNVRDQPGYDMHGLPIEVKVETALGIKNKKDIEAYGVEKFVTECRNFALSNLEKMNGQFRAIAVWMDWDNPYRTIDNHYIEAAWWTLRRAAERGLLVQSERVQNWCPRCETALAEAEVVHADREDPSIFVRFRLKERPGESILIWTTTPWTLPANLAVAVHPEFTYARVTLKREGSEEVLILLKEKAAEVAAHAGAGEWSIVEEMPGAALAGLEYIHPLAEEVPAQAAFSGKWYHRVLTDVSVTSEHTGCVHTAPGHGPEDFEMGQRHGLAPFCPVDGRGHFTGEAGRFAGKPLDEGNRLVVEALNRKGLLLKEATVAHRYGHCWRCKVPIIFRATSQWFLKVTEVKERMVAEVRRVKWTPDWAGSSRELNWVENSRDWCISRQRYWGIPLPVWRCAREGCGVVRVVGSARELEGAPGYSAGMDLHRPWIDGVVLKCERCRGEARRVPDVLDVWFDSAVAAWAQLGFPSKEDDFKRWFPCRWITESQDQTRGWFYSQLGAGVVAFDRAPYDEVLMHGWALDAQGRPMSKSMGNVVEPGDVIKKHGCDPLRFYLMRFAAPWEDLQFNWDGVSNSRRFLSILWNVFYFSSLYMALDKFDGERVEWALVEEWLRPEDRWLRSRAEAVTEAFTKHLEAYELHRACREVENFILEDLSRWYIRLVRDRTWTEGESTDKMAVYKTLHHVLLRLAHLLAPLAPHISDEVYVRLSSRHPTVHMEDWPKVNPQFRDAALDDRMERIKKIVDAGINARQKGQIKLRWPVKRIVVRAAAKETSEAARALEKVLLSALNARKLEVLEPSAEWDEMRLQFEPVPAALGPAFKKDAVRVGEAIRALPPTRELAQKLAADGKIAVEYNGKKADVTKEMVKVSLLIPVRMVGTEFDGGTAYIDTEITPELKGEGLAREVIRRVQETRKELDLEVTQHVRLAIGCDAEMQEVVRQRSEYIRSEVRARSLEVVSVEALEGAKAKEGEHRRVWELDGEHLVIGIQKTE